MKILAQHCVSGPRLIAAGLLMAFLAITGCHRAPPAAPTAGVPQSVEVAITHAEHWRSDSDYARIAYPVIGGSEAQRLDPVLQHWLGARCPVPGEGGPVQASAAACAAAFSAACTALKREYGDLTATFGCTLDATTEIKLDAAGLLGVIYTTYSYTGGAHGSTVVSYLNLDLASGRVLTLEDLLDSPDTARLSRAIEAAVRADRHIPAGQTFKQAGFFVDELPVPDAVLALPQGLLFTYQSYDVAPYSQGQPHGLVPYAALAGMIRAPGPLPRLRALGESLAPAS